MNIGALFAIAMPQPSTGAKTSGSGFASPIVPAGIDDVVAPCGNLLLSTLGASPGQPAALHFSSGLKLGEEPLSFSDELIAAILSNLRVQVPSEAIASSGGDTQDPIPFAPTPPSANPFSVIGPVALSGPHDRISPQVAAFGPTPRPAEPPPPWVPTDLPEPTPPPRTEAAATPSEEFVIHEPTAQSLRMDLAAPTPTVSRPSGPLGPQVTSETPVALPEDDRALASLIRASADQIKAVRVEVAVPVAKPVPTADMPLPSEPTVPNLVVRESIQPTTPTSAEGRPTPPEAANRGTTQDSAERPERMATTPEVANRGTTHGDTGEDDAQPNAQLKLKPIVEESAPLDQPEAIPTSETSDVAEVPVAVEPPKHVDAPQRADRSKPLASAASDNVARPLVNARQAHLRDRIEMLAAAKASEAVTLVIDPKGLGEIRVTLTQREGAVEAHAASPDERVREVLASSHQDLQRQFDQRGLKLERFTVDSSLADSSSRGYNSDSARGHQGQTPPRPQFAAVRPETSQPVHRRVPTGALDLAI